MEEFGNCFDFEPKNVSTNKRIRTQTNFYSNVQNMKSNVIKIISNERQLKIKKSSTVEKNNQLKNQNKNSNEKMRCNYRGCQMIFTIRLELYSHRRKYKSNDQNSDKNSNVMSTDAMLYS